VPVPVPPPGCVEPPLSSEPPPSSYPPYSSLAGEELPPSPEPELLGHTHTWQVEAGSEPGAEYE
jgi:hypothetical protein